jgi:hypothetical protein
MKGNSLSLVGTAIFLALATHVAMADTSPTSPTEIKMSPEGMKILCEQFPLNSRCSGGTAINPIAPSSTTVPTTNPGDDNGLPSSTKAPTTKPGDNNPSPGSQNVPVAPKAPKVNPG